VFGLRRSVGRQFGRSNDRRSTLLALGAAAIALVTVPAAISSADVPLSSLVGFAALGFGASQIRFGSLPREGERYSPGCLVVVAAALVGGPATAVIAAVAAAPRFSDRRATLFWLSEAACVGVVAGLTAQLPGPLPLRVAGTLLSVQLFTVLALAVVCSARSLSSPRSLLKETAGIVFLVELAAATPIITLLVRSYAGDPVLVYATIAALLAVIWIAQRGRDDYLRELSSEREHARRDPLTGLLNRRGSEEALEREHARVARGGETAGVLLIDFDRFHWINQAYDLAGGDVVLRELSQRLLSESRTGDVIGRWGGEELIVVAPGLDATALLVFAERARRLVRDTPVQVGETLLTVTCSVGAAMLDGEADRAVSLQRANRALKQAKETRDTACSDTTHEMTVRTSRRTDVDQLTGLLNRQALADVVLPREVERSLEHGHPLALMLVDVNDLKKINDLFGHAFGDHVVSGVAETITAIVGREELVFRIGGDEFAILLPVDPAAVASIATALLTAIARRRFASESSMPAGLTQVTASIGAASLATGNPVADMALATQTLMTLAEDALIEAKETATFRAKTTIIDDGLGTKATPRDPGSRALS
jgi:diguanylate cyclase (GGDEF)-like protein